MSHRQRAVALAVAVAIAVVVAITWLRDRNGDRSRPRPAEGSAQIGSQGSSAQAIAITQQPPDQPSLDVGPEKIQRVLDDYKRDAIYPHWSRPLERDDAPKLHWNQPVTSDLDMDDRPGQETLYRFDADRAHVGFGDALTSWIEVWHKGDRNKRLPITIRAASVNAVGGAEQGRMVTLAYRDDGKSGDAVAGDRIYTNRFVPSSHQELRAAKLVHIQADVEAAGATRVMTRDFTYAPRPVLEVEKVTDAIAGGHLAITLHVEVFDPGPYTIEANCFAADGTPIAYTREFFQLAAGKQTATLKFFGKIFHDKAADGPYTIRDVRGFLRFIEGDEMNIWFAWPREHVTAPYKRAQLDASEWDDEEKRARIQMYEQMLEEAKRGR